MPLLAGINYERRGSGEPLLLVHGIGSRWEVWTPVLDQLAAHYDVIALDVPGFGASPAPPKGTTPGIESMCDMLERFLAELGVERPHVAGNSMGGWIALELARRGAVTSAIGLSPAGFLAPRDRAYTIALLIHLRLSSQAAAPLAPQLFRSALGRKLGWSVVVAHPERMTPEDAVLGVKGMAEAPWFWPNMRALPKSSFTGGSEIEVPVTIAWGIRDHLLLPRQAATALGEIPHARFVSLPDCGHVPMYDDPRLVVDTVLSALTRAQAPA
ncbi:MAG: alpha/beta hydrolase [Solirubrobacterales bacterium]|nr:alpha/beta hydrolase [Solirubrobacterales bacterium]